MMKNINYSTPENIIDIQTELLKTTVKYLYNYAPYYKRIFDDKGINTVSIKTLEDMQNLPVVTKADLLEYNKDFFCCNPANAVDIVTTSGSTGLHPIIHPLTQCDLQRLAFNEQASFTIPGITAFDIVMLTTALDGSFVAGLAYYLGIKRLGASIIRAGSKNMSIQSEILKKYPVSTIIGVPSNLIKLHHYCIDEGIAIEKEKIKKMVLIGETIRNDDFTLNQLGRRLSESYPEATLYSTYANTETCTSFCECSVGNGGHLNPDLAYIEVLDENNKRVPERTAGRLVITTFGCQGMPLLRYDTGDITFIINEKCNCGRTTQRIGPILGRIQNILKINGITFSQAQLENVILSVPNVEDYCVIIQNNSDGIQSVAIYFTSSEKDHNHTAQLLIQNIWISVRISVEIKKCTSDELRKLQTSTNSRKPLRFINLTNGGAV
jgi:phenylacetate-CoA ligase